MNWLVEGAEKRSPYLSIISVYIICWNKIKMKLLFDYGEQVGGFFDCFGLPILF